MRPTIGIRTVNTAEVAVAKKMEADGYRLLKRGWPDFIAVKGQDIRFIEVKSNRNQKLKEHQQEVLEILQTFGIEVEVLYGNE